MYDCRCLVLPRRTWSSCQTWCWWFSYYSRWNTADAVTRLALHHPRVWKVRSMISQGSHDGTLTWHQMTEQLEEASISTICIIQRDSDRSIDITSLGDHKKIPCKVRHRYGLCLSLLERASSIKRIPKNWAQTFKYCLLQCSWGHDKPRWIHIIYTISW